VELVPVSASEVGLVRSLVAVALGAAVVASLHAIIPHTHLFSATGKLDPSLLRSAYRVAFGLILHDFPEGFAMAAPAVALRKRRLLFGAALLSALAAPAGALLGLFAVRLGPGLNPLFMAFAAGTMIFVSLHELLPMAQRYGKIHLFAFGRERVSSPTRPCRSPSSTNGSRATRVAEVARECPPGVR
jgi:ZIP family zinc transporter